MQDSLKFSAINIGYFSIQAHNDDVVFGITGKSRTLKSKTKVKKVNIGQHSFLANKAEYNSTIKKQYGRMNVGEIDLNETNIKQDEHGNLIFS